MSTTTHLMTAEELMHLDDDSHRHELIKGELLTMPLRTCEHGLVAANLMMIIGRHAKAKRLGEVCSVVGYKLKSDPDTVLGPDVSFVAHNRVRLSPEGYLAGPPDLAIELLSSSHGTGKFEHRLSLWLKFGTRSVWLVDPKKRTVEVIRSTGERDLLHETDELVDDTVPGFRVAVSEIFA